MSVYNKTRKCHECGIDLFFVNFEVTAMINHVDRVLGNNTFRIIWENDIFVLHCCTCFIKAGGGKFDFLK